MNSAGVRRNGIPPGSTKNAVWSGTLMLPQHALAGAKTKQLGVTARVHVRFLIAIFSRWCMIFGKLHTIDHFTS